MEWLLPHSFAILPPVTLAPCHPHLLPLPPLPPLPLATPTPCHPQLCHSKPPPTHCHPIPFIAKQFKRGGWLPPHSFSILFPGTSPPVTPTPCHPHPLSPLLPKSLREVGWLPPHSSILPSGDGRWWGWQRVGVGWHDGSVIVVHGGLFGVFQSWWFRGGSWWFSRGGSWWFRGGS